MEKTVVKVKINEQPSDFVFWQGQPYLKRLEAVENIRLEYHAWKDKELIPHSMLFNSQDFKEFIQILNINQTRYLIIGGYAVAFHGHPRYTKDLDVWIESTFENATRLVQALEEFGFGSLGLQVEDFLEPDQIIQLGYPPNRIDILTTLKGVDFETCYPARIEVSLEGTSLNFIDLENLKKNKKATGRLQDLADLEKLE